MRDTDRLTQIAELARAVVSELDLETVLSRVTAALCSLRADVVCGIRLVDGEAGGYRLAGTDGSPGARRMPVVVPLGRGLTHIVAETRRPLLADNDTDPRAFQGEWTRASGLTTYYGVPIEAGGELLGVVNVNFPPHEPPTDDERASIEVLAAQAAVAIRNARLFRELDERRRAAEAIANVGRVLAETLDETVVANRIVESVLPLFNAHSAILRRLRPDGSLVALAISGRARDHFEPGHVMPAGVGLAGRAVAEGRPIAGDGLDESAVTLTDDLQRMERAGMRGVLAVPFRVRGEMLGVLALGDSEPRRFSAGEIALLETFADQAALALHNAQLLQQAKARQTQLEALLDITRELSAIQPVESLIESIAATCGRLLGAGSVVFRLLQGDELVMTTGNAADGSEIMRKPRLKIGESVSGLVAATGEPLIVSDISADPRVIEEHREAAARAGYKQGLSVPAKIGGRVVGVFSIRARRDEGFSEADVAIATVFAAQAAIALETARLYSDAERRRQTAERLAEVGRLISQSLDLEEVARRVVTNLKSLVPTLRAALYRTVPGSDDLPLVADAMDPGVSIVGNPGFAQGEGVPGLAFQEGRLVVTSNLLTDPRIRFRPEVRAYWASTPVRAVAAVPLLGSDSILGVLAMADRQGRIFTDEELQTLEMFAGQAAIALGNARLYQQAREAYRELSETQAQLLQAGKLAAVGQLVAGVAHELNNPLAVVMGQANMLQLRSADSRVIERADKIVQATDRAGRIIKGLQSFVRPQPAEVAAVALPSVVERVVALRRETFQANGIEVEQDIAPGLPAVWGDAQQLEQVVLNLLLNAEHALGTRGEPRRILLRLAAAGHQVRLTVSDTGPGIAREVLPRLFEPFFTTKPVGQGTGLGLSISYGIVKAHRGRIWAESPPGSGATFVVELPAHSQTLARAEDAPAPPVPERPRGRVLIIDDEAEVAETLRASFEELQQEVTVALGGERGWECLTTPGAAYDLVTLDLKMPGLSGPTLWERLLAARSPMVSRIAFVTGDTVDPDTQRFLKEARRPVLTKPFEFADLAGLLAPPP
jgi:GAF domain-containing protein/CheY-like chemotaxis protein